MATEVPRLTPQMIRLLGALLQDPAAQRYGLELIDETGLKSGTIYPSLARLERVGWLESAFEGIDPGEEGRPRRRLYRLTGIGERSARQALDELAAELERARGSVTGWRAHPSGQPA